LADVNEKPVSLYPLTLEEAVSVLLEEKPEKTPRDGRRQLKT
jgi:hypothetical protein